MELDQNSPRECIQESFQIAEYLDTDSRNLKNCSLREGSVIVSMNVEGYDELEAAELEKATDDLEQMIAEGKVGLLRGGAGYFKYRSVPECDEKGARSL